MECEEAAIHSLEQGYTSYTANAGLLELREEISHYMSTHFSVDYVPESEIIVTVGASEGIDIAMRAILDPGDEVIVIKPVLFPMPKVELAGRVAIGTGIKRK